MILRGGLWLGVELHVVPIDTYILMKYLLSIHKRSSLVELFASYQGCGVFLV